MSDVAKQVVDLAVDTAENTTSNLLDVLGETGNLAAKALEAPVAIGDKALDATIEQARGLLAQAFELIRSAAKVVTDPLP